MALDEISPTGLVTVAGHAKRTLFRVQQAAVDDGNVGNRGRKKEADGGLLAGLRE